MKNPRLQPVDWATLAYVAVVTGGLGALGGDAKSRAWLIGAHALVVALLLLAPRARAAGGFGALAADWYPMVLLAAFYAEVGVLHAGLVVHYDAVIQRLDLAVFGLQPSYRWIRAMPDPLLSWVLHVCYLAYYGILAAAPVGLWASGRRAEARTTIFAIATTFYVCYLAFLFFPVTGPRYAFELAQNPATAVGPARLAQAVLNMGDSWGAAFPSSHVAGAVVATACALRFWRPLGVGLLPWTVGLTLGVVYGQFHYGMDAVAGLLVAAAVLAVVPGRVRRAATAAAPLPLARPAAAELEAAAPAPSPAPSPTLPL